MSNGATFGAQASGAYVHIDERALVLCDGRIAILFERSRLRWVDETLEILLEEGRATRTQSGHTFGGFVDGDAATIYAFAEPTSGVSITMPVDQVRELHGQLHG